MIRRTSLPALPFTDTKRHRRLSGPPPEPLPPLLSTNNGFVRVHVADFVAAPADRLSLNRNVLGPIDLARRPPCYDLRPPKKRGPRSVPLPQHIFETRDQNYIDTLTGILKADQHDKHEHRDGGAHGQQEQHHRHHQDQDDVSDAASEEEEYSESESGDDVAEFPEINATEVGNEEAAGYESEHSGEDQETDVQDLPQEEQPIEQGIFKAPEQTALEGVFEAVEHTSLETTEPSESALIHDPQHDSDRELTNQYEDLCEYDDHSDIDAQVDPDFDFDKNRHTASFILASMSDEKATITSNVLSTSSVADTSLSELPTIASIDTADGTSESFSSVPLVDEQDPVFQLVESSDCLIERKLSLPSFLKKKVPSPVKYTFRPLHKVPSNLIERPESNEITTIVPSKHPSRKTSDIIRHADAPSDSSSQEEKFSTESPTLNAVKSVVEKLDPHTAMGIVNMPPLALATVGFFKKKRDSEESIWSRKSDASIRRKRESDESTQSSNTEYYEDEYTKFISKKQNSPLSPLRIRNHPYFAKIKSSEDGLKLTKSGFRRSSSVSVSTSDEEYAPHSTSSQSISSKSNISQAAEES